MAGSHGFGQGSTSLFSKRGGHVLHSPQGHVLQTLIGGGEEPIESLHCFLFPLLALRLVCFALQEAVAVLLGDVEMAVVRVGDGANSTRFETDTSPGHVSAQTEAPPTGAPMHALHSIPATTECAWINTGKLARTLCLLMVTWGLSFAQNACGIVNNVCTICLYRCGINWESYVLAARKMGVLIRQ